MTNARFALAAVLVLFAAGWTVLARAQEPNQTPEPDSQSANAHDMPGANQGQMGDMASAVKDMADTCRMMMQREMQSRPYMMMAGAVVGAIGVTALILLIVLEIQGIRFLGVRIKAERQKLRTSAR